jgi:hypothetical protein
MQITDHNYEEYALDYIEGTLAAESRAAFERFLAGRPDLARQVASLQAAMPVLAPDPSVSFDGKAALKRRTPVRVWLYRCAGAAAVLLVAALGYLRFGDTATEPTATDNTPRLAIDRPAAPVQVQAQPESRPTAVQPEPPTPAATVPSTRTAHTGQSVAEPPRETVKAVTSRPLTEPLGANRPLALVSALNAPEIAAQRLAEPSDIRIVSVSEGYIAEAPEFLTDELPLPNDRGFLNLLSARGMRQLLSGIVTPLSEISPVSIHQNNRERVVEIASIPVSRKPNQAIE